MKIAMLDLNFIRHDNIDITGFENYGDLYLYDDIPNFRMSDILKDIDIIISNKTKIDSELISNCKKLKYIGLLSTGYNTVDLHAANEKNIIVTNVPNYSTDAVAQHTFALITELYSKVSKYNTLVKQGEWEKSSNFCLLADPIYELKDKTIGLIGFGNISKQVFRLAKAYNMKALVYNRTKYIEYESNQLKFVDHINDIFKKSDIVSIHCPLFNETRGLINKEKLKMMKPNAILINTSRGPVVDENDLAYALKNNIIMGAGVDVVSTEPITHDNPLLNCENCIITPHIAWIPNETRQRLVNSAVNNLEQFLKGKPINTVNNN